MLVLSRLTGQDALWSDGRKAGRVADLTVRLDQHATGPHVVERVVIRRRHAPDLLVPWTAIESFESRRVVIGGTADATSSEMTSSADLLEDELLLVRDVLDTQIFDVVGQRLARVADVLLSRRDDAALQLVGVEVGFAGIVRRLVPGRLGLKEGGDVVEWADLHLKSSRGHAVQIATPRSAVHHLDASGLAALVSGLDVESATEVLVLKDPVVAADVVRAVHPVVGESVLRAMPSAHAARIVAAMPDEHASRWRARLAQVPTLHGRRFIRSRVWHRRHIRTAGRRTGNAAQ